MAIKQCVRQEQGVPFHLHENQQQRSLSGGERFDGVSERLSHLLKVLIRLVSGRFKTELRSIYLKNCVLPTTSCLGHLHSQSLQSCLTLCDSKDCSPPGSSVHGILQGRKLEWVAMLSKDRTHESLASSALAGRFFTAEPPRKPKHPECLERLDRANGFPWMDRFGVSASFTSNNHKHNLSRRGGKC